MLIVFGPPLCDNVHNIEAVGPFESLAVVRGDGETLCAAEDLVQDCLKKIDMRDPAFRDVPGGEAEFTSAQTPRLDDGSPLYLVLDDDIDPPKTLRRITNVTITGRTTTYVEEVPLKHGQYDGVPYSIGTAVMGDHRFHWVFPEGADGKRAGARVAPVSDPTKGEFFEGKLG